MIGMVDVLDMVDLSDTVVMMEIGIGLGPTCSCVHSVRSNINYEDLKLLYIWKFLDVDIFEFINIIWSTSLSTLFITVRGSRSWSGLR